MNKIQRRFVLDAIDQQHKLSEWGSGFHYMVNGTEPEMWARLEDPEIKS